MQETNIETNDKVIDVYPLSKGKRLLLFLADYFIVFILSFLLFNVTVVPLGKVFTSYDSKQNNALVHQNHKLDILHAYDILLFDKEENKYNLNSCLTYSSKCFLSYYCFDEETPFNVVDNQFGHKGINETLFNSYKNVIKDETSYFKRFEELNKRNEYFNVSSNAISLKADIKTDIKGYFLKGDDISENGQAIVENITVYIYMNLFNSVTDYIIANDLTYNNLSYQASHKVTVDFKNEEVIIFSFESLVAVFLSWIICLIIIPLVNFSHKTIGMFILKCGKMNSYHLKSYSKKEVIFGSIYSLVTLFSVSFFLPMTILGSSFPFASQILSTTILLSLLFCFISFFLILFNSNNRSLSDICSHSVVLMDEDLDKIYSSVGKI